MYDTESCRYRQLEGFERFFVTLLIKPSPRANRSEKSGDKDQKNLVT